jgi:hypothetical protein
MRAGSFPSYIETVVSTATLQSSTSNSGLGDYLEVSTEGLGSIDFALVNGSTAPSAPLVVFESTSDGVTWIATKAYPKGASGAAGVSSASAAGVYNVTCGGAAQVRVRLTAIAAGSFSVTANGTATAAHIGVKNTNPTDLNATVTISASDTQVGNDGTGISQPTGGSGIRGWLSGIYSALMGILSVRQSGTTGKDYSANPVAIPVVGAAFGSTGPYANYVLVATVPASATRNNVDVENVSGAQIAVVRDDGTVASGIAPANASVFALGGGASAGAQGGAWSSATFKGRLQIYALSSTANVSVMVD